MPEISELELDLLLLCYLNANDKGYVDMPSVVQIARSKLGVVLPNKPMRFTQKHLDVLTSRGIVPPVKNILDKISKNVSKKKRTPKADKKSDES